MEKRRQQAPEVSSNAAEGQTKIHTLTQQRVQATSNTPLQVIFQSLQKLLDLKGKKKTILVT